MPGKLSIGIYEYGDRASEFLEDAMVVDAGMIFLHDQAMRLAPEIKARRPDIKLCGRGWWGNTEEQMGAIHSSTARDDTYYRMAGQIVNNPLIDYWQSWNEVFSGGSAKDGVPPDWDTLRKMNEADRGAADACRDAGKLLMCYSGGPGTFPTKHPDDIGRQNWTQWRDIMAPMFTYSGVGLLSIHLYGGSDEVTKRMLRLWEGAEWFILRHRLLFDALREDGIPVPDTVATEWGHGQDYGKFLNEAEVIDDFTWFGAEILKDEKLRAAFHFCTGDSGGWAGYDIHGRSIIPAMGAWNAAHPVAWEEPTGGQPVAFEWKLAFADYAIAHPEVGQPITDLMYDNQGNAWQYSERGLLLSAKGLGWQIFWLPNAQYPLA